MYGKGFNFSALINCEEEVNIYLKSWHKDILMFEDNVSQDSMGDVSNRMLEDIKLILDYGRYNNSDTRLGINPDFSHKRSIQGNRFVDNVLSNPSSKDNKIIEDFLLSKNKSKAVDVLAFYYRMEQELQLLDYVLILRLYLVDLKTYYFPERKLNSSIINKLRAVTKFLKEVKIQKEVVKAKMDENFKNAQRILAVRNELSSLNDAVNELSNDISDIKNDRKLATSEIAKIMSDMAHSKNLIQKLGDSVFTESKEKKLKIRSLLANKDKGSPSKVGKKESSSLSLASDLPVVSSSSSIVGQMATSFSSIQKSSTSVFSSKSKVDDGGLLSVAEEIGSYNASVYQVLSLLTQKNVSLLDSYEVNAQNWQSAFDKIIQNNFFNLSTEKLCAAWFGFSVSYRKLLTNRLALDRNSKDINILSELIADITPFLFVTDLSKSKKESYISILKSDETSDKIRCGIFNIRKKNKKMMIRSKKYLNLALLMIGLGIIGAVCLTFFANTVLFKLFSGFLGKHLFIRSTILYGYSAFSIFSFATSLRFYLKAKHKTDNDVRDFFVNVLNIDESSHSIDLSNITGDLSSLTGEIEVPLYVDSNRSNDSRVCPGTVSVNNIGEDALNSVNTPAASTMPSLFVSSSEHDIKSKSFLSGNNVLSCFSLYKDSVNNDDVLEDEIDSSKSLNEPPKLDGV